MKSVRRKRRLVRRQKESLVRLIIGVTISQRVFVLYQDSDFYPHRCRAMTWTDSISNTTVGTAVTAVFASRAAWLLGKDNIASNNRTIIYGITYLSEKIPILHRWAKQYSWPPLSSEEVRYRRTKVHACISCQSPNNTLYSFTSLL